MGPETRDGTRNYLPRSSTGTLLKITRASSATLSDHRHCRIPYRLRRESPHPGASVHSTHLLTRHLLDIRGYIRCFGAVDGPVLGARGRHCDISSPSPPIHSSGQVIAVVRERFFDFFSSVTSLILQNVLLSPLSALHRLTYTMDPQCELDSLSFATFYNLIDISISGTRRSEPQRRLIPHPHRVVFRNVGTTIMEALKRAVLPDLTSLTITSVENITARLVDFLEGSRGG